MLSRHFAPREDFRAFRPFPVSAETFSNVFSALGLPPVFLRVILSNLPMAMRFEAKCDPTNPDETKGRGKVNTVAMFSDLSNPLKSA